MKNKYFKITIMLIVIATFSIYRLQAQPISYYSGAIPANNACVTKVTH